MCDLGFAKELRAANGLKTITAIEVFKGEQYDAACDIWFLGILFGILCFLGDIRNDILYRMTLGFIDMESGWWCQMSNGARELVKYIVHFDRTERLTATNILKHSWIVN